MKKYPDFKNFEEPSKEEFEQFAEECARPDRNLCKFCRNYKKKQKFCRNCDRGSFYVPMTQPLFNLAMLYLSLESMIDNGDNSLKITALRDAIKTLIHPIGIEEAVERYREDLMSIKKDTLSIDDIEKAQAKYSFNQGEPTETEEENRMKFGTTRCHSNACTHCVFSNQFNTKFCWKCDRGSNFRNGIRSLEYVEKALMFINTAWGEGAGSEWKFYFAEGLKWVIKPYTTEEKLIQKHGFKYVTEEEVDNFAQQEIDEYNIMYSGKTLY